jgi:hypothetical protein
MKRGPDDVGVAADGGSGIVKGTEVEAELNVTGGTT